MTRSSSGIALVISATISRSCSLGSVGKFDSVIRRLAKFTSRSLERDARVGFELDGAERRLGRRGRACGLIRRRRERDQLLLVGPARDLRLVDDDASLARRGVGARPAGIGRRRGSGGGLAAGLAGACAVLRRRGCGSA